MNKSFVRLSALILAMTFVFSFSACNGKQDKETTTSVEAAEMTTVGSTTAPSTTEAAATTKAVTEITAPSLIIHICNLKTHDLFFIKNISRAISAGFVRDLRRICSGIAPSLRAIPVEITRKSGKDCA